MAFEYQGFATLGVNLNRQKYGPLDISNVFTSEADLKYYLTKGTFIEGVSEYWYKDDVNKVVPYPYEGQVLATVINGEVNVYVLAVKEDGTFETREIADKIEVDGTTIVKDAEGKLSIVAPVNPDSSKSYNFSYANGVYSWVEVDTATAAGQAQAIQGLTDRAVALEEAVNGKGEGEEHVKGLIEKVADLEAVDNATQAELDAYKEVVSGAIAEALQAAKDYADQNDANTVYDDTELAGRVKAIEDDYLKEEDKYDDSELKGRVDVIERDYLKKSDETIYDDSKLVERIESLEETVEAIDYVDTEELATALTPYAKSEDVNAELAKKADKEAFEELKGTVEAFLTGDGTEAALDSLKELIEYINTHDDVEISGILSSIQAIEGKLAGVESTVVAYVTAAIEALKIGDYAKAADLTNLASRVEVLEAKPFDTYATKTEVETVNGKFANYTTTEALNGLLDVKANAADVVSNEVFGQFQTSNTDAISAARSGAVTDVEAKGYAVATEVKKTYATKSEVNEVVEGIENDLLAYAKTEDVNKELAKKIETGSIAHTTEELAEGVTVNGTKLDIVVDAFTKAETRQYVANTINQMTGGESAADVLRDLNAHITTYTEKVGQIDAKDTAQDTAIAAAQTQADKGVADAKKVSDDLATANGKISANEREIGVVKGSITTVNETLSGKITALENKDIEIAGLISGLDTAVKGNATTIGEHTASITALTNKDAELAGQISTVEGKFANYYDKDTVDAKVKAAIDAIPEVDFKPYATNEYVNAELAKKANAADVYTKEEANAAFMSQDEVDSRINALIVSADPEGGKTIENIQNLVKYVDENAGEIASLITAVEANTNKLEGIDSTVTDHVSKAIAAIPAATASALGLVKVGETMSVTSEGVINVAKVSTDILVQGELELVLNGGSAK
jgi:hypothetical protein